MKKILITGANSYIGTSFEKYMAQWPDQYQVDTVDMIDGSWREKDFSGYDCVYHVAGIAHIKETEDNAHLYYEVNRDLAVETAQKAKSEGVKQFVFLSTMAVYGLEEGAISHDTEPAPKSHYGKAKYEAELQLNALTDEGFAVAIMRPSKSVQDLEAKSVKKKFKNKKFAAGCSREVIRQGADMLGWELADLSEKTILAMRSCETSVAEAMNALEESES